jgi:putative redox protein
MTMEVPLASADARLASDAGRAVELRLGPHTVVVDHAERGSGSGPTPLELMTGSLAACSAMTARTYLERDGDPGDIEVVVTLDAGPPTLLYRRVLLGFRLDHAEAHGLVDALEHTEVTMMLRPAFTIRTQIEHAGKPLT